MTSTPEPRRFEIEKLREKAVIAYDRLMDALDEDEHDEDCVLRCFAAETCYETHSCPVCKEDGEL